MAVRAKHPFVSAKADSPDATKVRASNWNADHTVNLVAPALIGSSTSGAIFQTAIGTETQIFMQAEAKKAEVMQEGYDFSTFDPKTGFLTAFWEA